MGSLIIDEQKFIDDNSFKFEERISSPLVRFLDKNPVFVTYYHIDNNESTVANGWEDIKSLTGKESPLKYQKITKFPIFGLEKIMLSIEESEQGIDVGFQSEAVILPNTIKPLPNDLFMINHIRHTFIFRITDISIDSIRADNFYKIEYKLEYTDESSLEALEKHNVHEKYDCILQNIGTEDKCIIREDYKQHLLDLNKMYEDIVELYKMMFYDKRYNCLIIENDNSKVYDPYQTMFLNKHNLLNRIDNYNTIYLSMQISDNRINLKYEKSVYKFIERQDVERIKNFMYEFKSAMEYPESAFYRWHDGKVAIIDIPEKTALQNNMHEMFSNEFIDIVRDKESESPNEYIDLIKKFINNQINSIYDIKLTLNQALVDLDNSEDVFFFTPIILYIIKKTVDDFMKDKRK